MGFPTSFSLCCQTSAIMGRMHAPGKGLSQSALPYRRSVPTWLKLTSDDVKEQIYKCCEEELDFRAVVMDEMVLTVEQGNLGLRISGELISAYPQVVVVRVPTPWVQSDSDITVLRHLEKMGCRLMNRPQAILNCVNKFWTFQELAGHGVPLPDTFSYGGHENFAKMIDEAEVLEFPMVVKNTRGHRGKAVFLARDKHHLADLSHLIRHEAPYLFQKYIKESHGRDVRVIVVGGRVVGTMLRCSTDKSLHQLIQKRKNKQTEMCSSVTGKLWFLTDRRIREDYPQKEILRALKAKCCELRMIFKMSGE